MPVHAPKMGVRGTWSPKWRAASSWPPKGVSLCKSTSLWRIGQDHFTRFFTVHPFTQPLNSTLYSAFPSAKRHKSPLAVGACASRLIHGSLDPTDSASQSASSAVFQQLTAWESPYALQRAATFPFKISGSPSSIWLPGFTWVKIPNGITIGLAAFPGFTVVTDRQIQLLRL